MIIISNFKIFIWKKSMEVQEDSALTQIWPNFKDFTSCTPTFKPTTPQFSKMVILSFFKIKFSKYKKHIIKQVFWDIILRTNF